MHHRLSHIKSKLTNADTLIIDFDISRQDVNFKTQSILINENGTETIIYKETIKDYNLKYTNGVYDETTKRLLGLLIVSI